MAELPREPITRQEEYLSRLAGQNTTLPREPITREEMYLEGAIGRVEAVEKEVEEIKNNPDVVDIVATYADLQSYDTSKLTDKDVIRVLADETHSGNSTYYRWDVSAHQFDFIAEVTSSGGITELTSADYNWPVGDPQGIAYWLLDDGVYYTASGVRFYYGSVSSFWNAVERVFIVETDGASYKTATSLEPHQIKYYRNNTSTGDVSSGYPYTVLTDNNIVNNLTSTNTGSVLSAYQGKVLNDTIDGLVTKGAGAPTTSTAGTVGKLYEDTTNGKLYICTDATNPYTWSELGAGGGGANVIELTTADYNYPENNPNSVALWKLENGVYHNNAGVETIGDKYSNIATNTDTYIFVSKPVNDNGFYVFLSPQYQYIYYNISNSGAWSVSSSIKLTTSITDALNSTSVTSALSANQGRVLNGKITPDSGSGAPTTATVGALGKVYVDTDTDTAYMCTKVDSGTYTWKQITS